jgi:hypothetical protein
VKEFVDACIKVTGASITVEYGPRRPGDYAEVFSDPAKAKKELVRGWPCCSCAVVVGLPAVAGAALACLERHGLSSFLLLVVLWRVHVISCPRLA